MARRESERESKIRIDRMWAFWTFFERLDALIETKQYDEARRLIALMRIELMKWKDNADA